MRTRPILFVLVAAALMLAAPAAEAHGGERAVRPGWAPGWDDPLGRLSARVRDTGVTFAIIGDQGTGGEAARAVAALVAGWQPQFVVSVGDSYYDSAGQPPGGQSVLKYDRTVGALYCAFLKGVAPGPGCPTGGQRDANAFFPALGNHDYSDAGLANYLAYFALPGNERYYDFVRGPVNIFVLNSNTMEPDGARTGSKQARWLQAALAASRSPWKIVVFHHSPYSSGPHGGAEWMRWPFAQWGADAVISGHDHVYERVMVGGLPYFVDGLGGGARYALHAPGPGSVARFNQRSGALRVRSTATSLVFEFVDVTGNVVDRWERPG